MSPTKVVIQGVLGKMGQEVLKAVSKEPDMRPHGAVDTNAGAGTIALPSGSDSIPLSRSIADVLEGADVVVDFTNAEGAMQAVRAAAPRKVNLVVGSTGFAKADYEAVGALAKQHGVGILIAPNFTIGAVVMMHLAKIAAKHFEYADLIEFHSEMKLDSPSGTAVAIANAAVDGHGGPFKSPESHKELVKGARGGVQGGINIHAARMPGTVAHHSLVFGHTGQTLTIRHDSINRESFMPGVMLGIRQVLKTPGLTIGLDKFLGL